MSLGSMSYHDLPTSASVGNLKYVGNVAAGYDAKRVGDPKWQIEQRIIEEMMSDLPQGSWVLDAPCGTGRFANFCRDRGLIYRGIDLSPDMIAQAAAKLNNQSPVAQMTKADGSVVQFPQLSMTQGNVLELKAPDKAVDATLNIRVTRWLQPEECQQMFREMQRVARDRIILTARVANHAHMRPLHLFEAAMEADWALERSEAGHEKEYRIFMFRNKKSPFLARKDGVLDAAKADDGAWTMKPYEAS